MMAFRWRRRSGVGVGFFVVVVWEVVESLERLGGIGVERDTIFACVEEIFENMDGSLIMLVMWGHVVGRKEGERRRYIWAGTT